MFKSMAIIIDYLYQMVFLFIYAKRTIKEQIE